jgi:RHS repeat-associated protein
VWTYVAIKILAFKSYNISTNSSVRQLVLMNSLTGQTTDRGFTMHEHLDEMGVIHMNGRIYDPLIGRFMSADPILQAPGMLQSYNRYAYVMNNPLNLTDPSGFSWWTKIRGFVVTVVAAVADGLGCAGYCSTAVQYYNTAKTVQNYYNAYRQGGWSALGRSYARSTLSDFVGQSAFGVSGDVGVGQEYGLEHYAATAAAGCVSSVASGSKCGSGAAAAIGGKFATELSGGLGYSDQTRSLMAQAAGGLAAEAAGGKFANGAQTAAYGYLFNQMSEKGVDIGKTKSFLKKLNDALNIKQAYQDAYDEGAAYAQQKADDKATMEARIQRNPDSAETQKSAQIYKEFGGIMASPISKVTEYAVDIKNPLKIGPAGYGYYRGMIDCVCVGRSRE